jgi:hypothetical protein
MVSSAIDEIKRVFPTRKLILLDAGKEINSQGDYLVFNSFKPHELQNSGTLNFDIYVAINSLQKGIISGKNLLDEIMLDISKASSLGVVLSCRGVVLKELTERFFVYVISISLEESW